MAGGDRGSVKPQGPFARCVVIKPDVSLLKNVGNSVTRAHFAIMVVRRPTREPV